jgi:hypothetical protein
MHEEQRTAEPCGDSRKRADAVGGSTVEDDGRDDSTARP